VTLDDFLGRLQGVTGPNASGWYSAKCPAHEDQCASFGVRQGDRGIVVKCQAGCTIDDVVAALKLTKSDLFPSNGKRPGGRGGVHHPRNHSNTRTPGSGLTLAQYAEAKRLPIDFLRSVGLSDLSYLSAPAIKITYSGTDGAVAAVRFRISLDGEKFRWRSGSKAMPYGLDRIEQARSARLITVVEGESDCHALWHHGIPAIGVPGASTWKNDWSTYLDGIERVYVVREPDRGGDTLAKKIAESPLRDRLAFIHLASEAKDPSALYLKNPETFVSTWTTLCTNAIPWTIEYAAQQSREATEALRQAQSLLDDPKLLDRVGEAITAGGYAGDIKRPLFVYVALTSRFQERPINVAVVAPSAAGKNATVDAAVDFIPPEDIHTIKAGSARAIIYGDEEYAHRVVYFQEADSIPEDGPAASAIRALAEDNSMEYDVVERDESTSKWSVRRIVKEGPTGLITTSTRAPREQLGTRLLELSVPDDPEHTGKVIAAHAAAVSGEDGAAVDRAPFLAVQTWLKTAGERRVIVPFANELAALIPPAAIRMRRDSRQLFSCIQTIAFLYQRQRERTPKGAIIATIADYTKAKELLAPIFDTIVAQGVTPAIRETVEAIKPDEEVSEADLVSRLDRSKGAISYRCRRGIEDGWIVNRETRKGYPARLARGADLPDVAEALPDPAKVEAAWRVRRAFKCSNGSGEMKTPPPPYREPGQED
jgi:hypothetical protein